VIHGKRIKYSPWELESAITSSNEVFCQSIFFQGNGRFGLRAVLPGDTYTRTNHGVYKAGCFEYIKTGITDMVNLPDPFKMDIIIGGQPLSHAACLQTLDMKKGVLRREWTIKGVNCIYERVILFSRPDLVAHRLEVHAKEPQSLLVFDYIDGDVENLPINDDQTVDNDESIKLLKDYQSSFAKGVQQVKFQTLHSTCSLKYCKTFASSGEGRQTGSGMRYEERLDTGSVFFCEAVASLDGMDVTGYDFSTVASQAASDLSQFWDHQDIRLEGPVEDQCAIRYALFMMKQNAPEPGLSIGARGLSHSRYKGCYFWDTEVFILPYYLYTQPDIAKNIIQYRVKTFSNAKAYAKSLNLDGARYPWLSSLDGSEQCESWDTGKCEVHVTSDITWAMDQYVRATDDRVMEKESLSEIYLETARFWASRFTYSYKSGEYEMLFVKGPDEYAGVTKNNTFTTMMALHTLKLALEAADRGDVDLQQGERETFLAILKTARIPYSDELGTYLEDDLFEHLEAFDLKAHKMQGKPLYHTICFDRLQRYKVIKQPDVILLYLLLPKLFSKEEALNAWNFYEPLTSHDSTLSWGMHALAAFRLGLREEGEAYFSKAMFLDLEELMENTTGEGLHIGAMGAFLQALLFGVVGLSFKEEVSVCPSLPASWEGLTFEIAWKKERYLVQCTKKGKSVEKISLTNR